MAATEEAKIEVEGFDFFEIGATGRFGTCSCIVFPQPTRHLIGFEGSLNGAAVLSKFAHLAADEK